MGAEAVAGLGHRADFELLATNPGGAASTAMVQAQSLARLPGTCHRLGRQPQPAVAQSRYRTGGHRPSDGLLSFESLIDLLERSAVDLGCADFGLRLAERQDIGVLGTLAVAMRYSTTVGEAMRCASKYLQAYNAAIAFTINTEELRSQARLIFKSLVEHAPRWAQTAEHGIGLASRIMTLLSEGRCRLQQVWFPHPAVATEETYRSRFDAPVNFRADRLCLAYAARDLDLPISGQNRELHELATRCMDASYPEADPVHRSGPAGHRGPARHRHLRTPAGSERPLHASPHPAAAAPRRRRHLRGNQGRGPSRSRRALPLPTRLTPHPGDHPA